MSLILKPLKAEQNLRLRIKELSLGKIWKSYSKAHGEKNVEGPNEILVS